MNQEFAQLKEEVLGCTACRLCEGRTNVVFGAGCPTARVMIIGEGPGRDEDLQGQPFVGRSGQLMDKMLGHVGLSREKNIFIGNMVKCRPPENRDPRPDEVETCIGWLRKQVAIIRPKIIVCMGRVAATSIIDPHFKVTQQHGQFFEKNGTLMMGTFHPAALLRNPNNKPAAMQDMLDLQAKIMEVCPETYAE